MLLSRFSRFSFLGLLPLFVPLWLFASAKPDPTPVRDADAACARCHAQIVRSYLATPMANASGAAMEKLRLVTYVHPPSGVTYTISAGGGQATLTASDPHVPAEPIRRTLSYFLGSGHLGVTYLYFMGDALFESPVAWYAASSGYDMKPGLGEMRRMPPAIPAESACLRCHMSAVQSSLPGTMNRYRGLPFLHGGITCEACHGDAAPHLRSGGKAAIVNPAHLAADGRDSVCISCHLEGDVTVERAGKSALNYQPGQSISTYLAFYIRAKADPRARGVSEVEQLSQSTCKRTSGDKMSCMSCHDPHFTPRPDQRVAFYRGKCLACHARPAFAASHHPENPDCTSCHMQRTGAENIPHVAWTDHRILRVPDAQASKAEQATPGELQPIFSPGTTRRDLAMAEYQLLLEGDRSQETSAWTLLSQLKDSIAEDKAALDAWGNLSAERGDFPAAEAAFLRVLKLDPVDLTALSNLGILRAKQGNLAESAQLLGQAFDNNNDIAGLAMNLARVECAQGDARAAENTLQTALVYNPALDDLRRLHQEIHQKPGVCLASAKKQ
jgi:Tetratricopeptide repeat/Cytochrome c554 and c-prime